MVAEYRNEHVFDFPWTTLFLAFYARYPNPYASHVLHSDVISRNITYSTAPRSSSSSSSAPPAPSPRPIIHTQRLLLKTGRLPRWAPKGILQQSQSWVLEESWCDVEGRELDVRTRNLDHLSVMEVIEDVSYKGDDGGRTDSTTQCAVKSSFGFSMLSKRIESFGQSRLRPNTEKARKGLTLICSLLSPPIHPNSPSTLTPTTRENLLTSGPLSPFDFSPFTPPSVLDKYKRRNVIVGGHPFVSEHERGSGGRGWDDGTGSGGSGSGSGSRTGTGGGDGEGGGDVNGGEGGKEGLMGRKRWRDRVWDAVGFGGGGGGDGWTSKFAGLGPGYGYGFGVRDLFGRKGRFAPGDDGEGKQRGSTAVDGDGDGDGGAGCRRPRPTLTLREKVERIQRRRLEELEVTAAAAVAGASSLRYGGEGAEV